jgi:hypothetical protein
LKGEDKAAIDAKTEALMTAASEAGREGLRRHASQAKLPLARATGAPEQATTQPTTTWSTLKSRK